MMERSATFSQCRSYRYSLWRNWGNLLEGSGYAMFIGLNPSTADERNDDPTIRRCIAFAQAWGFDGLCMTNLFAYRATEPADMLSQSDPVGEDNDKTLCDLAKGASLVVAAWGVNGTHLGRDARVKGMVPGLRCLRLTKKGHPGHPLYLPKTVTPVPFV